MAKMDDGTLKALIASRRGTSSITSTQADAASRREAMKFYRGDPLGNEEAGMSQVVSRDVMEAVESMLPGLLRPFVSGDETVKFEPTGPEDEDGSKQATEYINYLFHTRNRGFKLLYDAMKDGLMFRLGVWKAVWETDDVREAEDYEGITEEQLQLLEAEPSIKVTDIIQAQDTGLFSAHLVRTRTVGRVKVCVVPPDEFLFEKQLASLDDATYLAHRSRHTVADLIEMGLPKAKCLLLSDDDDGSYIQGSERSVRFEDEGGTGGTAGAVDDMSRFVWVTENYIKCDYDGDGAVEWRRVFTGGSGDTILANEECDGHPFSAWTPIPVTHKLVGMSVHDEVRDIQLVKTGIMREVQNGLYLMNRPQREIVEGQVNIDDILRPRVGGAIRVKQMGMMQNVSTQFDVGSSMSVIEYYDGVREARTGSTRYNQGQDANSLNKTATGISLISNASHAREELISRQFAEALKDLFRRILKLVCTHQNKAEVIRLRGTWVDMDPSEWNDQYDMSVSVGLGTGDKQQQIANIQQLMQVDAQIVQLQGGVQGPVLTAENIYEKLKRLVEAMGLKGIENYYTDPAPKDGAQGQPQQPEQPDPQALAHQAQQQAEQAKMQQDQAKMQLDAHNAEQARQLEFHKATIASQTAIEVARIGAESRIIVAGMKTPPELMAEAGDGDDGSDDPSGGGSGDGGDDSGRSSGGGSDGQDADVPSQAQVTPEQLAALQAHFAGRGPMDVPQPEIPPQMEPPAEPQPGPEAPPESPV